MSEVGFWRSVPEWSLGGNDRWGDCVFVTQSNYTDLRTAVAGTPEVVMEAEAEYWYGVETGWTSQNPLSDKGEALEAMLRFWRDKGNPSDPTDRITSYAAEEDGDIAAAIPHCGALFAWCKLPMLDDDPDLSDGALERDTKGTKAHAVLIVGATDKGFVLVTWAEAREVSRAWWYRYGCQQFSVEHPAWSAYRSPGVGIPVA